MRRLEGRNLAAQFRTDGTATPGDEDCFATEPVADPLPVKGDRVPAEDILDRDIPELIDGDLSRYQCIERGYCLKRNPALLAQLNQVAHLGDPRGWHGKHDEFDIETCHNIRYLIAAADDRDTVQVLPLTPRLVIDEGNRHVVMPVFAQQVAHQHFTGLAGADNQYPLAGLQIQLVIARPAIQEAGTAQEYQQQQRVQQHNGSRRI